MTRKQYNPQKIEGKWQKNWAKLQLFRANDKSPKTKFYCLDMFPYPSSNGLHVGHPEGYTATDIVSRYKRMKGFEVLHPMGWDAFGLPAENFAIKSKIHPKETTNKSIETFKKQIQSLGLSYDWDREVSTCDPSYYKWTQWIFLQFYKNGLAYKKKAAVNWCESCKTVLANEQVQDGKCERCKNNVIQKDLKQWFFKTTAYAERLLNDLKHLDWPEPIKSMQENWIGRSEGIDITYKIDGLNKDISVFTTRPDTNFGATFIVAAPDSKFAKENLKNFTNKKDCQKYIEETEKKSELDRISEGKKKTGTFTGLYAINNLNKKKMPIYLSDFVLGSVGTGVVVGVPGHDLRDFEFAQAMDLEVIRVVVSADGDKTKITKSEQVQEQSGIMINSDFLNGLEIMQAKEKIMDYIEKQGWGKRVTNYRLKDWLISRQRYWGAPIPIIYCAKCGEVPVAEKDLPVQLPEDVDFKPTGESPLVNSKTFHSVACPQCGARTGVRREVDTMDTFVCSSWYLLRYCDPKNKQKFADNELLKKWLPVDLYVGGAEHACMHLIYARFFYKALKDLSFIKIDSKKDNDEPFSKLENQGMILGEDHQKMSKSRGNVINPDEVVSQYGADTLRMYEMFMGTFDEVKPWDTKSIVGIRRFLERVWNLQSSVVSVGTLHATSVQNILHKTIKKVTEDIENFRFNTAISAMMILVNEFSRDATCRVSQEDFEKLLLILSPFAPHLCEELWEAVGHKDSIMKTAWPEYDKNLIKDETVQIIIQINGKLRDKIIIPSDQIADKNQIETLAQNTEKIKNFIADKKIRKIIYVKGRLVNIVI